MYILTITLNPAIDKTIVIPNFKPGKVFRPEQRGISAGGKGVNVSKVLSTLERNTLASGLLPRRGADFIECELEQYSVKHDFVKVKGDVRTNLTIINPTSKRATRVFEHGGVVKGSDIQAFKRGYLRLLKKASIVVISGSNAPGIPDNLNAQLVSMAKQKGIVAVLDTSGKPLELGIKRKPFMIKPNFQEAEELLNLRIRGKKQIEIILKDIYSQGVGIVALTNGKEGAYIYNGTETLHIVPPKIEQKNPVGCGDAFVAGYISAYLNKNSFQDCARFASACGCVNAMSINPGEISLKTLDKVLKRTKILK